MFDHELSVPAVTYMILSCVAFTTAACLRVYLDGRLTPELALTLRTVALLATIGIEATEDPRSRRMPLWATAAVAVLASHLLRWQQIVKDLPQPAMSVSKLPQ